MFAAFGCESILFCLLVDNISVLGKLVPKHRNLLSRTAVTAVVTELVFIKGSFACCCTIAKSTIHRSYSRSSGNRLKYYVSIRRLRCIRFNLLIRVRVHISSTLRYKNRIHQKTLGSFGWPHYVNVLLKTTLSSSGTRCSIITRKHSILNTIFNELMISVDQLSNQTRMFEINLNRLNFVIRCRIVRSGIVMIWNEFGSTSKIWARNVSR